jgi:ABC-type cobalamin/Fe3+-siderophores transport system ATPase subunit
MSARNVQIENVGPIEKLTFSLPGPGVHVLSAPNGSGKSILLNAVQTLASGKGSAPLRDGAKRGRIEGFGATILLSNKATHGGEFEVASLEGRFDLAELVDPQLVDPLAADRRRIRALVSLTGGKADLSIFKDSPDFPEFDSVVTAAAASKHDLVDMAEQVKRDYEAAARKAESDAEKEAAAGKALTEAIGEVDPAAETDEEKLKQAYDQAVLAKALLQSDATRAQECSEARQEAQQRLEEAKATYTGPTSKEACAEMTSRAQLMHNVEKQVAENRKLLADSEALLKDLQHEHQLWIQRTESAQAHEALVKECEQALSTSLPEGPTPLDLANAEKAILTRKSAMDYGVTVRNWRLKAAMAAKHRDKAREAESRALALRGAAGSIEGVLSDAIHCEALTVASLNGKARLVVEHPTRGTTPYHELSDGERWKIAIDLGADQVGEGGLLVIPQLAWESLDSFVRPEIHQHAVERGVYVLTAEATRDTEEGRGFQAKPFAEEVAN